MKHSYFKFFSKGVGISLTADVNTLGDGRVCKQTRHLDTFGIFYDLLHRNPDGCNIFYDGLTVQTKKQHIQLVTLAMP